MRSEEEDWRCHTVIGPDRQGAVAKAGIKDAVRDEARGGAGEEASPLAPMGTASVPNVVEPHRTRPACPAIRPSARSAGFL
jgi:hypothetical protein